MDIGGENVLHLPAGCVEGAVDAPTGGLFGCFLAGHTTSSLARLETEIVAGS